MAEINVSKRTAQRQMTLILGPYKITYCNKWCELRSEEEHCLRGCKFPFIHEFISSYWISNCSETSRFILTKYGQEVSVTMPNISTKSRSYLPFSVKLIEIIQLMSMVQVQSLKSTCKGHGQILRLFICLSCFKASREVQV